MVYIVSLVFSHVDSFARTALQISDTFNFIHLVYRSRHLQDVGFMLVGAGHVGRYRIFFECFVN